MANDDSERLARARAKMSREDASILRATAHGWIGMEEVVLIGSGAVAQLILRALDVVSIVQDTEPETAATDQALSKIQSELYG